jgi:diaminohydroxyphosphoribosylaminopyrimidine deaminase/5-amino-6-(5-phosphoribosylamino)uracil reductase
VIASLVTDDAAMALALDLAAGAQGFSSPNPPVGAVIARDGIIVGQGATQPAGGPHAEIVALAEAGARARGATLFVTLEPHSFHGRTPPCTDAIIAAGVARVVVSTLDPNPRVNGQGVAQLRAAGIAVEVGLGAERARWLVTPFAHWLRHRQPLGVAKFAMSLDGKIATRTGASQWITSPQARARGHTLRQASDAIVVGIGTALADDPLLTTRLDDRPPERIRHPLRVVVDARGRLPLAARLIAPTTPGHALIATTERSDPAWRAALNRLGVEVAVVPAVPDGRVDLAALWSLLGERGALMALVEGGSALLGAAFQAGSIQRVVAFVAPIVLGGSTAPGPVGDPGVAALTDALRLHFDAVERAGDDIMLAAEVPAPDP